MTKRVHPPQLTETRLWKFSAVQRYVNVMRVWADLHAIVFLGMWDLTWSWDYRTLDQGHGECSVNPNTHLQTVILNSFQDDRFLVQDILRPRTGELLASHCECARTYPLSFRSPPAQRRQGSRNLLTSTPSHPSFANRRSNCSSESVMKRAADESRSQQNLECGLLIGRSFASGSG